MKTVWIKNTILGLASLIFTVNAFAEEKIGEPVEVIDSFFQPAPADARPLWFLGKSLELLSIADMAYFVDGWTDARGCRIEHLCALEYGIDIIHDEK